MSHGSRLGAFLLLAAMGAEGIAASGPFEYHTPFFGEHLLTEVVAGDIPSQIGSGDGLPARVTALIAYIHLTGKFNERHARLFTHEDAPGEASDYRTRFGDLLHQKGYEFNRFGRSKLITRITGSNSTRFYIENCQEDAFKVASETFEDRRTRYGSGSPQLARWIEAQIKVFSLCGGQEYDPPDEPQADWLPLEKHDRRYQIAASYFYHGQYLEAAARFEEIGRTPDSPWRDLGRYLVPRSLVREATVYENEENHYLNLALTKYKELADDAAYLAAFPSVIGQIRHIETRLDALAVVRNLEERIIEHPGTVSNDEMHDYRYLLRYGRLLRDEKAETEYEHWFESAATWEEDRAARRIDRWQEKRSLPWLFLALTTAGADIDERTLADLLDAAAATDPTTPGYYTMLRHRIRLETLRGNTGAAPALAQDALRQGTPTRGQINRLRLSAANASTNWTDYLRWASLKPLRLRWSDGLVRSLPVDRFNTVTSDTTLFSGQATRLINNLFTPSMILDVLGTPGLSDYQRGRMAIAGWVKAMLADDLARGLALSTHIRSLVPPLETAFERFETGKDKRFEAARIVFDNPAFSPQMAEAEGRIHTRRVENEAISQPAPDDMALPLAWRNWWCARGWEWVSEEAILEQPQFARYSESRRERVLRELHRIPTTTATEFFGPHAIRYAKSHLHDPRVPRTLHRVVFATRYACETGPASISRQAYTLLHEHFPDSEWAAKTPYWYE